MITEAIIHLTWSGRLRALFTGEVVVSKALMVYIASLLRQAYED